MPVRFSCPNCRKKLKVADGGQGRHARCSRCGLRLLVPEQGGGSYPMALPVLPVPPAAAAAAESLETAAPSASGRSDLTPVFGREETKRLPGESCTEPALIPQEDSAVVFSDDGDAAPNPTVRLGLLAAVLVGSTTLVGGAALFLVTRPATTPSTIRSPSRDQMAVASQPPAADPAPQAPDPAPQAPDPAPLATDFAPPGPDSLKKKEVIKLPQPEADAKAAAQPVPAQPVPGQQYGPVPSLVRPGKTGAAAYDAFPEPWRSRFIKEWEGEVTRAKNLLGAAEQRVRDAEKAYARDQAVQLPNGRRLALDREAIAAAKKAAEEGQDRVAGLEKNDPPYFTSNKERQKAEFAALPPAEQEGRRAEKERQQAAEEERKRQKAARVEKLTAGLTEWERRYVAQCEPGGRGRHRRLQVNDWYPLASLRTGDYGYLTFGQNDFDVVVKQVVSGSEMLVCEHRTPPAVDWFWVEGVSTEDLTDGVIVSLEKHVLMVAGTKTYATALGTKTVKRLVVVNTRKVREVLAELGL
jgi:hypothetical protein